MGQKDDTGSDAIIVSSNGDTYTGDKNDNDGNRNSNTSNTDGNNDKLAIVHLPFTSTTDEKRISPFSTSVASVASVADNHDANSEIQRSITPILHAKSKTEDVRLPALFLSLV